MPQEDAEKVLMRIINDDDFRKALSAHKTREERMEFLGKEGYTFTQLEFLKAAENPNIIAKIPVGPGCAPPPGRPGCGSCHSVPEK